MTSAQNSVAVESQLRGGPRECGRIGHALSTPVVNHCRVSGVLHGYAELGERGVVAALAALADRT
ncbi:MAG: hypothetical protein GY708_08395 [Actinomycetia bacterium]|nr:hypothetical protein [Actinomycetes bacterium]